MHNMRSEQKASTFNKVTYSVKGYAVQTIDVIASIRRLFDKATFVYVA